MSRGNFEPIRRRTLSNHILRDKPRRRYAIDRSLHIPVGPFMMKPDNPAIHIKAVEHKHPDAARRKKRIHDVTGDPVGLHPSDLVLGNEIVPVQIVMYIPNLDVTGNLQPAVYKSLKIKRRNTILVKKLDAGEIREHRRNSRQYLLLIGLVLPVDV